MKPTIGVIGVGRLGICFALLLEKAGYQVRASDIRTNYVAGLNKKQIVTAEPQVADLLSASANITFTTDTRDLLMYSHVVYVMVATPSLADGSYDISAIRRVIDDVKDCDFDLHGKILVIGCTTNPGDCQSIQEEIRHLGIQVLYNPEFIAQGSIVRDLQQADMVLIGGENQDTMDQYSQIYHDIQTIEPKVHTMSLTAAELVKIGTNCFLTTKISYANMVGEVLIRSGLHDDVDKALTAIGSDSRVGSKYMRYGFGYGGPCLPRDNRSFDHYAKKIGLSFPLGQIVDQFNKDHSFFIYNQVLQQNSRDLPVYLSHITYKSNTDIIEESQQLMLCINLLNAGKRVLVEPNDKIPKDLIRDLTQDFGDQIRFIAKTDLINQGQEFFEVDL